MSEPIVTIIDISKEKLSNKEGFNVCNVSFKFDSDVVGYTVNVSGESFNTGVVVDSKYLTIENLSKQTVDSISNLTVEELQKINSDTIISVDIDSSKLYEGNNRINIYGKSINNEWTSYNT